MLSEMDRIAPSRRPDERPIGFQKWRDLLFLHWPVPVEALRPRVPRRLTLDLYEGAAYVGVIPFAMKDVRPAWVPQKLAVDSLETNVRTYVHLEGRDPGVYFFSLDAQSMLAVLGARIGFGLPYYWAAMQMRRDGDSIDYRMQRRSPARPSLAVRYRPGRGLGPSQPGTLEHWLVERYLLYVERAWGALYSCQVHHQPYPLQEAEVLEAEDRLVASAGLPQPASAPLAHYAPGVDVEVFAPKRRS